MTFQRRDPLYVLNPEDPANPTNISEFDVSGISGYLRSINDDKSMIIATGEEADDFGSGHSKSSELEEDLCYVARFLIKNVTQGRRPPSACEES